MKKTKKFLSLLFVSTLFVFVFSVPVPAQNADQKSGKEIDRIRSELSSKTITLNLRDTPFKEVINLFRQRVSFNIILDEQVEKKFGREKENGNGAEGGDKFQDAGGDEAGSGDSGRSGGFGTNSDNDNDRFGNNTDGFENSSDNESGGFGSFSDNESGNDSGNQGFGRNSNRDRGSAGSNGRSGRFGLGADGAETIDRNVTITLKEVSLERALKIILDRKDLTAVYRNGLVYIVPEDEAKNRDIRMYDVRDVLFELKDFKGPILQFRSPIRRRSNSSSGANNQEFLGGGLFESDRSTNRNPITNKERFLQLIRNNVGSKEDWANDASMKITNGILVVNQSPEIHEEISFLINRLRRFK